MNLQELQEWFACLPLQEQHEIIEGLCSLAHEAHQQEIDRYGREIEGYTQHLAWARELKNKLPFNRTSDTKATGPNVAKFPTAKY